jgi:hypothetical protein
MSNVLTRFDLMSSIDRVTDPPRGRAHAAPVACVAFRADGRRLASGSHDRSLIVWEIPDPGHPVVIAEFAHRSPVTAVAWNPAAADLLATGTADGTVAVWRVVDDRPPALMKVLTGHPGGVTGVAWMPDGQHLLCLIDDTRAAVWHVFTEAYLGELDCVRLAVSPDGLVATVDRDGRVGVRDLWRADGRITHQPAATVEDCAWSPDGRTLALAGDDGSIELLDPTLTPVGSVRVGDTPLRSVTWSADGRQLIAGTYDPLLISIDTAGLPRWRRADALLWPRSLVAAGSVVAAATFGGRPHLLDMTTGTGIAPAATPADPSAAFRGGLVSATGRIVTAGRPGARQPLWQHDTRVAAVATMDDRLVVSAAHRAVRVQVLAAGELTAERAITLEAPEPVKAVAVLGSPSLPVVVAASHDFRLWSWTLDGRPTPAGPRLIGEFTYGIAALTCLDRHRLTVTDHRGELALVALGPDGAVSA